MKMSSQLKIIWLMIMAVNMVNPTIQHIDELLENNLSLILAETGQPIHESKMTSLIYDTITGFSTANILDKTFYSQHRDDIGLLDYHRRNMSFRLFNLQKHEKILEIFGSNQGPLRPFLNEINRSSIMKYVRQLDRKLTRNRFVKPNSESWTKFRSLVSNESIDIVDMMKKPEIVKTITLTAYQKLLSLDNRLRKSDLKRWLLNIPEKRDIIRSTRQKMCEPGFPVQLEELRLLAHIDTEAKFLETKTPAQLKDLERHIFCLHMATISSDSMIEYLIANNYNYDQLYGFVVARLVKLVPDEVHILLRVMKNYSLNRVGQSSSQDQESYQPNDSIEQLIIPIEGPQCSRDELISYAGSATLKDGSNIDDYYLSYIPKYLSKCVEQLEDDLNERTHKISSTDLTDLVKEAHSNGIVADWSDELVLHPDGLLQSVANFIVSRNIKLDMMKDIEANRNMIRIGIEFVNFLCLNIMAQLEPVVDTYKQMLEVIHPSWYDGFNKLLSKLVRKAIVGVEYCKLVRNSQLEEGQVYDAIKQTKDTKKGVKFLEKAMKKLMTIKRSS